MGKFSTYRYLELKDDSSTPHISSRSRIVKQPRRLKKVFILLVVLALCVTYLLGLFAGQTQWFDGLAKSLGYENVYHHAVIIDAGSSGSRVLAYKFRVPFTIFGPANLDLVDEFFEQTKPGLSSYADEPAKGAETIVNLINKASFLTPVNKRSDTPLIVRATAGLRLLPKEKAQQLIDAVSNSIAKLGYYVDSRGVQIMDGADEGIFIWYTINLLHNLLDSNTMAALDLGGGSTQITYQLSDSDVSRFPIGDQYVVPAGRNITLYTHSYLKLGLLAARYGVFRMEANNATTNEFKSACVEPIVERESWIYANTEYIISGKERVKGMKRDTIYATCHGLVRRYVLATLDWEPTQAPLGPVAAMSFFYDVAADAGLIDWLPTTEIIIFNSISPESPIITELPSNILWPQNEEFTTLQESASTVPPVDIVHINNYFLSVYKLKEDVMRGGTVTVAKYRQAAVRACSVSNVEQPWACIDLVYVVTLLQDAYKITDNVPISLFKKVDGHEVSWALGLAYTTVMSRIAALAAN